ncbi:uncharacterized protein CLUP02_16624 [Colletotrichum lupini]|uniref:Uncharacterized protein n=1 Tax=Colletotrichum lupini TaxID=145971 RepID=A0A9Q8T937_9PEZI|nr:uncharacterized protein CLUP02_16624 [Colletotrichum lupini]UQC91090.1 hypothetical protein CLUP02_16624 [Colletotrichum lupini]
MGPQRLREIARCPEEEEEAYHYRWTPRSPSTHRQRSGWATANELEMIDIIPLLVRQDSLPKAASVFLPTDFPRHIDRVPKLSSPSYVRDQVHQQGPSILSVAHQTGAKSALPCSSIPMSRAGQGLEVLAPEKRSLAVVDEKPMSMLPDPGCPSSSTLLGSSPPPNPAERCPQLLKSLSDITKNLAAAVTVREGGGKKRRRLVRFHPPHGGYVRRKTRDPARLKRLQSALEHIPSVESVERRKNTLPKERIVLLGGTGRVEKSNGFWWDTQRGHAEVEKRADGYMDKYLVCTPSTDNRAARGPSHRCGCSQRNGTLGRDSGGSFSWEKGGRPIEVTLSESIGSACILNLNSITQRLHASDRMLALSFLCSEDRMPLRRSSLGSRQSHRSSLSGPTQNLILQSSEFSLSSTDTNRSTESDHGYTILSIHASSFDITRHATSRIPNGAIPMTNNNPRLYPSVVTHIDIPFIGRHRATSPRLDRRPLLRLGAAKANSATLAIRPCFPSRAYHFGPVFFAHPILCIYLPSGANGRSVVLLAPGITTTADLRQLISHFCLRTTAKSNQDQTVLRWMANCDALIQLEDQSQLRYFGPSLRPYCVNSSLVAIADLDS